MKPKVFEVYNLTMFIETLDRPVLRPEGQTHSILPASWDHKALSELLLDDSAQETLVLASALGIVTPEEVFANGRLLLERGNLSTEQAGNVLSGLYNRVGFFARESAFSILAQSISRSHSSTLPQDIKENADEVLREKSIDEIEARVIHMLFHGEINLYPWKKREYKPAQIETGLALIQALATLPEFRTDFRKWCQSIEDIDTTTGATLPHSLGYLLELLGMDEQTGSIVFHELKKAYKSEPGRALIKLAFDRSVTNSGTGDEYASLDAETLPFVAEKIGPTPGWVELAVSRGVVWLGTYSRMKSIGVTPRWMTADLYTHDELLAINKLYYSAIDTDNPWKIVPYNKTNPDQVIARVHEVFNGAHGNRGFVRGNFEKPDFPQRVLSHWRSKDTTRFPDVIRSTGTLGVTGTFMENLIKIVRPNGGLILLSEYNSFEKNTNTVWQVFRGNNTVKLNLLYTSG